MIHELRVGNWRRSEPTPLTRYYGTVDATPLFLCLLAEHAQWSGTLDLFRELREAVEAALGWIDDYGDHDGDGLLDYHANSPTGLRNQGWRDSDDGVLDEHGVPLEPPDRARSSRRRYAARAKRRPRRACSRMRATTRERERWRQRPRRSSSRLERFWLPTDSFYSIGARPRRPRERCARLQPGPRSVGRRPSAAERAARDPRCADERRALLRLGHPDARPPRGRLQPGRLPPRHCVAARQRAVRGGTAPLRLRRRLRDDLRGAPRGRLARRRLPPSRAVRRLLAHASSRRPCPTPSRAARRRGQRARSRTC